MKRLTILYLMGILLLAALAGCGAAPTEANNTVETALATTPLVDDTIVEGTTIVPELVAPDSSEEVLVALLETEGLTETAVTTPLHLQLVPTGSVSDDEAPALAFMREEEKLAHDVYLALYEMWGLPVFQNIAASEQAHSDAVLSLLQAYSLPDPAAGNGPGQFSDPALQNLYDQMVAQGSQSLLDGLRVGATIEEVDILDLQARLAQTTNAAITQVYQNLSAGSENHLRSFVSMLARQGETYAPQYLLQEAYDAILSGQNGQNGNGAGGNQGQGGSGQGQNGQSGQGQGQGRQRGQGQGGNGRGNQGGSS